MNTPAADRLDPTRAADLAHVLDLQAQWENLRADGSDSTARLQALQRTFEAFRLRMAQYTTRYRSEQIPDLSPSGPDRLRVWCEVVRAVMRRAEGGDCPTHVVTKAYRLADRIAAREQVEPVGRGTPPTDMAEAMRQLDRVIAWCDGRVAARPPLPVH